MILKILIVLALILAAFVVAVLLQPSDFKITRSATVNAPAAAVFAQVNDFHKWEAWSPWAKMDPAAKNSYEGPAAGKGALFRWEGNNDVGAGNMTITESRPSDLILIRLEFLKPMPAVNTTEFTFKPDGSQTLVTWTMSGKNNFMGKAFGLIVNCDKMVGGWFEKGLASIKSLAEAAPNSLAGESAPAHS
jgi:polyketide cyclase/dehydrase/lipid transport protein